MLLPPSPIHQLEPPPKILDRQLPPVGGLLLACLQLGPVLPREIIDLIVEFDLEPVVALEVVLLVIEVARFVFVLRSRFLISQLLLQHLVFLIECIVLVLEAHS